MEKPECRKCGERHWRFKRCEVAAAEPPEAPKPMVVPVFHSHADRRLGSRLTSLDQTAPRTFMRKRD
jgi:hypothetical protein